MTYHIKTNPTIYMKSKGSNCVGDTEKLLNEYTFLTNSANKRTYPPKQDRNIPETLCTTTSMPILQGRSLLEQNVLAYVGPRLSFRDTLCFQPVCGHTRVFRDSLLFQPIPCIHTYRIYVLCNLFEYFNVSLLARFFFSFSSYSYNLSYVTLNMCYHDICVFNAFMF